MENSELQTIDLLITAEIKESAARGGSPLLRSLELSRRLQERGISIPNPLLAEILASNLCFSHNTPSLWKLLEQSMALRLVSPCQTVALLTQRVIPQRNAQPGAYRLYLELLRRYALALPSSIDSSTSLNVIVKSIDESLQLSQTYELQKMDLGQAVIFLLFSIIKILINCILEDCGVKHECTDLQFLKLFGSNEMQDVDMDAKERKNCTQLYSNNTILALEVIEEITANKKTQIFLRLVHINMPDNFDSLLDWLQLLETQTSKDSSSTANNILTKLFQNIQRVRNHIHLSEKGSKLGFVFNSNNLNNYGVSKSGCWITFDIFMENAMDGGHLSALSAIEILTEITKTLQVVNQASWQETFLSLWISALRLIQRGHEHLEGPVPHIAARLCMLLAIIPLSISPLVKFKENEINGEEKEKINLRKNGLINSLQVLSQFTWLLSPPPSLINAANEAATKAALFMNGPNTNVKAVGNMRHLIVEACIARNLIDTSFYTCPNYVIISPINQNETVIRKESTPASSIAELEKLYEIATSGQDDASSEALKILCGACLLKGWNFQEHTVELVIKLLSPRDYLNQIPVLNSILSSLSHVDTVHILSLYGLVPELAAVLMPICETFGSIKPPLNNNLKDKSCVYEEASTYSVFSKAFLLLLRLWKFYRPPQELCLLGRGAALRLELTLDFLLSLRNNHISLQNNQNNHDLKPVYIDSFPKLRAWYFQNQACISSVSSGLCNENPIHEVANKILNMIWGENEEMMKSNEDKSQIFNAWEILEALPIALEVVLTACAFEKLSSRDLITGLRDLVDFLPASLAVIVSYFSAEITRGIWKPVSLNGIDWPSPAANLLTVDTEIKEILSSARIEIPNIYPHGMQPSLPLPMAILVSLTITFKLEKDQDYILGTIHQALENCASTSSSPSMPIIASLWTQKAKKWHDFIVLSCTRSPLSLDNNAITQLIRSCFNSFLQSPHFSEDSAGVSGLLGNGLVKNGTRFPVKPGLLYIYSIRSFNDVNHASDVIFRLVVDWADSIAVDLVNATSACLRSTGQTSLSFGIFKVKEVVSLAASMLCIAGGAKLVQALYEKTFPSLLLLYRERSCSASLDPVRDLLRVYAVAYLLVISGAFIWGVGPTSPVYTSVYSSRRGRVFGRHMDLLASVMEGDLLEHGEPGAWRFYVVCFVGLILRFTPRWIQEVRIETLRKMASGLKKWNEAELALLLLEKGGPTAMSAVVELLL